MTNDSLSVPKRTRIHPNTECTVTLETVSQAPGPTSSSARTADWLLTAAEGRTRAVQLGDRPTFKRKHMRGDLRSKVRSQPSLYTRNYVHCANKCTSPNVLCQYPRAVAVRRVKPLAAAMEEIFPDAWLYILTDREKLGSPDGAIHWHLKFGDGVTLRSGPCFSDREAGQKLFAAMTEVLGMPAKDLGRM